MVFKKIVIFKVSDSVQLRKYPWWDEQLEHGVPLTSRQVFCKCAIYIEKNVHIKKW